MLSLELFRNFVAVYRSGSVSSASRLRSVSQPAVSQQLASLEEAVGVPLFERTVKGMIPTARGEALYIQIFEPLDRIERVIRSLGRKRGTSPTIRLGTSPEYFHGFAMRRLGPLRLPLAVRFGDDRSLLEQVEQGALDLALTVAKPTTKSIQFSVLAEQRFVLIGGMDVGRPPSDIEPSGMGAWLNAHPWVSYSEERPVTRRFFQQSLGVRFEAAPALVVSDMRAVVSAVEMGIGISIVPEFICIDALADDRVQELWRIGDLIPRDRWHASYREVDSDRPELRAICEALAAV